MLLHEALIHGVLFHGVNRLHMAFILQLIVHVVTCVLKMVNEN
jgi:hypothetical protein